MAFYSFEEYGANFGLYRASSAAYHAERLRELRWALFTLVHPLLVLLLLLLLLLLLSRPRVKDLCTRGSEAGEGEG